MKHGPKKLLLCARQWPSYFQLPVLMLMLITLLNDGTLISIGYDRAAASTRPERWNLRQTFFMASVLGLVACLSSLLLLGMCLDASTPGSVFQRLGLPPLEYGKIITLIYLKACRCTCAEDTQLLIHANSGLQEYVHRHGMVGVLRSSAGLEVLQRRHTHSSQGMHVPRCPSRTS